MFEAHKIIYIKELRDHLCMVINMEILTKNKFNQHEKVIILGNFDGIHKGHQKLIKEATNISKRRGMKTAIFTFDRHPSYVIAKSEPVPLIYTKEEKQRVLNQEGIDYYIEYPFTVEFASLAPEEFIRDVLIGQMNAKSIVVGSDYRFGSMGKGDTDLLNQLSETYSYELTIADKVMKDGREISSSWIREELLQGNIMKANELLGRDYLYIGEVVKGEQIGRTIGFPTANIIPCSNKVLPPLGVYYTNVEIGKKCFKGITNIGCKPTVSGKSITVETHIIDFNEIIYGQEIIVKLKKFIRSEVKFSNLNELKNQINQDIKACKAN